MNQTAGSEYRMLGSGSRYKIGWHKELGVGASLILETTYRTGLCIPCVVY
jgi:hypothetical protein